MGGCVVIYMAALTLVWGHSDESALLQTKSIVLKHNSAAEAASDFDDRKVTLACNDVEPMEFRQIQHNKYDKVLCNGGRAPSPMDDMQAWFNEDRVLTWKYWDHHKVLLKPEHIAAGFTPYGHVGARRRLQEAGKKLLRGDVLNVWVYGGSMTFGKGSQEAWPERLQTLASKLGYRMNVTNLAKPSTTSGWLSKGWRGEKDYKDCDMVIVDYSVNDGAGSKSFKGKGSRELITREFKLLLSRFINLLPRRPAVIDLETLSFDADGLHRTLDCDDKHRDSGPHWAVLRELDIPTLSYTLSVCNASNRTHWGKRLDRRDKDSTHVHPDIIAHDLLARLVLGAMIQEMDKVCSNGVTARDHPRTDSKFIGDDMDRCLASPSTHFSSEKGETGFPAKVKDEGVWRFYEDAPGRPGWIAAGDGHPGNITFDVNIKHGWLQAQILGTYENIGSMVCWLDDEAPSRGNGCFLDGLWESKFSLPRFVEMRATHAKGNHLLKCRTDGKKFKLMSLTTC